MQNKPLTELLHDLEQEMLRLGYTQGPMQFYRKRWQMLLQFAKERGEVFFSENLGIDFLENNFPILDKDSNRKFSQSKELRVIQVILDFQLHHTILRRCCRRKKKILTEPNFLTISHQFKSYCVNKGYAQATIDEYVKLSAKFMDYLASQKIISCQKINLTLIHNYIQTLLGYTYKTVEKNICSLRAFFRFLLEIEEVVIDFAEKMPMVQARKQTRIPSVWTTDELKKLIAAIDRGSPKGKRDYAIILLACCLGIRRRDIKHLKIENFKWEEKKLIFTQSKTKTTIALPLTPEVGWAVIDYLKYGRPKIDSPFIFVTHVAPFDPFAEADYLNQLIKRYIQLAHLPTLNKKRGMHSLRHTLASHLLEKDTPLAVISDILGHMNTDSTAVYLKVDMKKLKECALTFREDTNHE